MKRRRYPNLWPYYRTTKCPRCLRPKAFGRFHLRLCDDCTGVMRWAERLRARILPPPIRPQRMRRVREEARRFAARTR